MSQQKTPPSLFETQLWMKWMVTDPRGVREALTDPFPTARPHLDRYTSPLKDGIDWIKDTPPINKIERLDIYAEAYFSRVIESMKSDFKITERVLGETSFKKLVADYLKTFPSRTTNIGELGRHFSTFVATYADLNEAQFLETLINFEWLMIESFYANDTGFLESSQLSALSDEDWAQAQFKIASSVFLINSNWPLDKFFQWSDDSVEIDPNALDPLLEIQGFMIVRQNGFVSIEQLSSESFCTLNHLNNGESLLSALEKTQNTFTKIDIGSQIMTWFNDWVRRGIIYDVDVQSQKESL